MDQFQKVINATTTTSSVDLSRLNQFALREADGTYQFITMPPRSMHEQEYIDHTLLTPDYLGDNIQNALVVDLLQTTNGNAFQHTNDRQFLTENELVGEVQIHHELNEANDNRVKQALLQFINKNYQNPAQIITTEHVVNLKPIQPEMPPLAPIRNLYNYQREHQQQQQQQLQLQQTQPVQTNQIQLLKEEPDDDGRNLKQFDYDDNESIQSRLVIKKNLPHKKRIVTKLKIISKKGADNKTALNANSRDNAGLNNKYTCELCGFQISEQLSFFSHLKLHYEPTCTTIIEEQPPIDDAIVQRDDISLPVLKIENLNNEITEHDSSTIDDNDEFESSVEYPTSNILNSNDKSSSSLIDAANDEFSDTEDMLEGIRSVVDKVQQSVENDLRISNNTKDWFDNDGNLTSSFDTETDSVVQKHADDLYGNIETIEEIGGGDDRVVYNAPLTQNSIPRNELEKTTKEEIEVKPALTLREMRENYVEEREENDMESKKSKGRKKIYVCKVCEKVCNSRNALHYHFLSHSGERPHVCEECGKRFYSISALKVHRRVHTLEKPFNCDHCGRAFRQWGDLSYHITSIHTEEKSHTCEFCGKNFARRYSLVIHRRIHTNERNYKCDFCPKSFRASSYLQDHRKIHTGEKNHKCPTCSKLFRVRGDLKIHLRLIAKEQSQKLKDDAEIVDNQLVIYNENTTTASDYKIKSNKQTNDPVKSNIIYSDAANGDIFNETSNLLTNEVATTSTNNNIESTSFRTPRKRKAKSTVKQKKVAITTDNLNDNLSVFQLPSTIESMKYPTGTLVTALPVDVNKMVAKQEKVDNISVSVSEDQYEIYLLGA